MERFREKGTTIQETVASGLCTGCGTCASVCPQSAIRMVRDDINGIFVPELRNERCTHCGNCIKACTGYSADFRKIGSCGKPSEDNLVGNFQNLYTGHATDYTVRYNSAAGGLVTALLIYALEEGLIDGALITRMKDGGSSFLEPEPFIARTKEEIFSGMGSKYCPVPANIALKQIQKENGKYAVVGLPCHVNGLRKAAALNEKLSNRIVLCIGLFCSFTRNFLGTEYLFWKFGVKKEDVVKLAYRGEGWLGGMTITLKDGRKKFYPYLTYNRMWKSFFVPSRCTLCNDHFSELADISCGDIWLPEFRSDKIGTSAVISRNKIGDKILKQAISGGRIELKNVSRDRIIESQKHSLTFKKELLGTRVFLFQVFGRSTPIYDQELPKPKLLAFFPSIILYLQICLSSRRHLWPLLSPFSFFLEKINRIYSLVG